LENENSRSSIPPFRHRAGPSACAISSVQVIGKKTGLKLNTGYVYSLDNIDNKSIANIIPHLPLLSLHVPGKGILILPQRHCPASLLLPPLPEKILGVTSRTAKPSSNTIHLSAAGTFSK
jgi:hypothetical protein